VTDHGMVTSTATG